MEEDGGRIRKKEVEEKGDKLKGWKGEEIERDRRTMERRKE